MNNKLIHLEISLPHLHVINRALCEVFNNNHKQLSDKDYLELIQVEAVITNAIIDARGIE